MIQDSGHFDYDSNLDAFYDYEKYGQQRIQQEQGIFTERGYIAYQGTLSLDELMRKEPAEQYQRERDESMEMGDSLDAEGNRSCQGKDDRSCTP